jgi:hypothetical protein
MEDKKNKRRPGYYTGMAGSYCLCLYRFYEDKIIDPVMKVEGAVDSLQLAVCKK